MAIVQKNSRTQIRIEWGTFNSKVRLDIREWYLDEDSQEWRPSKRGVPVPSDKVEEFVAAVNSVAGAKENES